MKPPDRDAETPDPRLRALHVYPGNLYGGIEAFLVTLARSAAHAPGMSSEFALCFEGRLADELRAAGAAVHELGETRIRSPWSVVRARSRLARAVRQGAYDVVVCHSPWAQAVFGVVPAGLGVPSVFWLHEAIAGRHWLERWARRTKPSFCVANSHFSKSTLALLYRDVPAAVAYCPVPLAPPPLTPDERRALRRELGADDDTVIILQTSRMQPLKGQKRLLRAVAALAPVPRVLCLEVGGPQRSEEERYLAELLATAEELGLGERVRFLGQRSDVPRLLAAADVFCQPNTLPDSFGIVLIEALSAGLPVVAADMGGPREIVTPEVGFLVGDDAALERTLGRLVESPELRRTLGAAGPTRARLLCDPSLRMPEIQRVLSAAARTGRAPGLAA